MPERPSVRPSGVISLTYTLDARLFFFLINFAFFVENHLLGNTKLSFLDLWALQAKGLIFLLMFAFFVENHLLGNTKLSFLDLWALQAKGLIFLLMFAFFVENHLLGNTKLSFLVLWFKSYMPCRQRALYCSLFLHSLLKITY